MEKNNISALLLMGLVIVGYMTWNVYNQEPVPVKLIETSDSTQQASEAISDEIATLTSTETTYDSLSASDKFGRHFSQFAFGEEQTFTIETELYTAKFSKRGASLIWFELKDYKKWDGVQSQLIWPGDKQLYINFLTTDGRAVDSRELYFEIDQSQDVKLSGEQTHTLIAKLDLGEGRHLTKKIHFKANEYAFDMNIEMSGLEKIIKKNGYNLNWSNGLHYQEYRSDMESNEAEIETHTNGESISLDASDIDEEVQEKVSGSIDYIAIKNKYFTSAIITDNFDGDVVMTGIRHKAPDNGMIERYDYVVKQPYNGGTVSHNYKIYIGPLDYDIVSQYGLSETVNLGWWLFRYIGEYMLMPFFMFLNAFFPNWGITIIIFSIALKLLLMPLSKGQMQSSRKMKLLAPDIAKIREKHADDSQKQQKETMALYSQYGVNPMGGCLPMILQMPILYTLWTVFSTNIYLRQADFAFWIHDLSMPDYIFTLPFPIMGFESMSGLALAMAITMFIQQKMTISDPKQKAMIYMMPLMFMFMFSNFPSGLNLYYFIFNILGILQQVYINYFSRQKISLEQMRKAPKKKEGFFQKKMKEMQQVAEQQQKAKAGGGSSSNPSNPNRRKRKNK